MSAAAASCLLLGAPSTESVSSFLSGALTGGVPAAYADEEDRTEIAFASDTDASTVSANEAGSSSSAESSDLQIVDEVWKVVDDNFLPLEVASGFDRDAWAKLRDAYVADPPKSRAEAYGKVREILRTLGDPFSRFVDPADFAPLLKYDISGVGLNIAEDAEDPERLKVLGLVLDSPAARAGVKQGDELVAVDGVSVRSRSAFQAVSLIQAAPGPDVAVTVRSEGSAAERVVKLRRSSSAQNPVSARLEGGNVGYIRLREFNALAEPNVARAVETLRSQGAESFVLDLRDNPGASCRQAWRSRVFSFPRTRTWRTRRVASSRGCERRDGIRDDGGGEGELARKGRYYILGVLWREGQRRPGDFRRRAQHAAEEHPLGLHSVRERTARGVGQRPVRERVGDSHGCAQG